MQYPTPDEVEQGLKHVATEIGDPSADPFRVNMVPVYGGKPPLYTVVIRSAEKEPLRRKLGQMLNRSFSLDVSSFALKANEAQAIILQYGRKST